MRYGHSGKRFSVPPVVPVILKLHKWSHPIHTISQPIRGRCLTNPKQKCIHLFTVWLSETLKLFVIVRKVIDCLTDETFTWLFVSAPCTESHFRYKNCIFFTLSSTSDDNSFSIKSALHFGECFSQQTRNTWWRTYQHKESMLNADTEFTIKSPRKLVRPVHNHSSVWLWVRGVSVRKIHTKCQTHSCRVDGVECTQLTFQWNVAIEMHRIFVFYKRFLMVHSKVVRIMNNNQFIHLCWP